MTAVLAPVGNVPIDNKELLLASMRCAVANLRTWQVEIETCGVALKSGAITTDDACAWLDELGLLMWLPDKAEAA